MFESLWPKLPRFLGIATGVVLAGAVVWIVVKDDSSSWPHGEPGSDEATLYCHDLVSEEIKRGAISPNTARPRVLGCLFSLAPIGVDATDRCNKLLDEFLDAEREKDVLASYDAFVTECG